MPCSRRLRDCSGLGLRISHVSDHSDSDVAAVGPPIQPHTLSVGVTGRAVMIKEVAVMITVYEQSCAASSYISIA